jgi:hypothetical protein
MKLQHLIPILATALLLPGCGTDRGIPSHGGGKRFDEEQRAVSAAIRRTVASMQLDELRGKPVLVVMQTMAHNGGAQTILPGLETGSLGFGLLGYALKNGGDSLSVQNSTAGVPTSPYPVTGTTTSNSTSTLNQGAFNAGLNFRTQPYMMPHAFGTESDGFYLKSVIDMRLSMQGMRPVPEADAETAILVVLVDVLGTDRSRDDWLLWSRDSLEASVELTYYAIHPTHAVIFAPRRVGARADYTNVGGLVLFNGLSKDRSIEAIAADELPVDNWPMAPQVRSYQVKAGDALKGIAERELGSPDRWKDIAAANPGLDIRQPLKVGQTLNLPTR